MTLTTRNLSLRLSKIIIGEHFSLNFPPGENGIHHWRAFLPKYGFSLNFFFKLEKSIGKGLEILHILWKTLISILVWFEFFFIPETRNCSHGMFELHQLMIQSPDMNYKRLLVWIYHFKTPGTKSNLTLNWGVPKRNGNLTLNL